MERLEDAREKLLFIQNIHADSQFGPEARRILGEINLDEVLSVQNMSNKTIHLVEAGKGAPLSIANRHQTTLDCMMFLNGRLDMRVLHPGDELIVMPLDFKLVIDVPKMRVELYHRDAKKKEDVFTKEYLILETDLPRLGAPPIHARIVSKKAEAHGRLYPPSSSHWSFGTKIFGIKAGNRIIYLRPLPAADDEEPGRGVFLGDSDMEELAMLLRLKNEVEIKLIR
jgi:hypothetical protein